jgi:hypothetical protein
MNSTLASAARTLSLLTVVRCRVDVTTPLE